MSLERKWLLLLLPVVLAASASAAELPGRWLTEPGDGIIEISQTADGSYQGRIIGGNAPGRVDAKNPDPARRQRLLLGQVILVGMRAEGPGSWSGGTIYDTDSGKTAATSVSRCSAVLRPGPATRGLRWTCRQRRIDAPSCVSARPLRQRCSR
jgi:hypothetical protein